MRKQFLICKNSKESSDSEIAKTASLPQTRPEPSEVPSMELHFARIGEGMEKINPRQTELFLRLTNSLRGRSGAYDEQADDPIADRRGIRCRWHLHFHAEIDRNRQSSLGHKHRHPRYYQGGQADAFGAISGALIRRWRMSASIAPSRARRYFLYRRELASVEQGGL
jgi:hypothetical protein